ncbi:MAG: esterase-like activity of phytase family protein [Sphingomonas sp.]
MLLFVPGWSGDERLPLLGPDRRIETLPVTLDPADPSVRRTGDLAFLGGLELRGRGAAFGGFSSLHIANGRFTLLSDGGNIVSFRIAPRGHIVDVRFAALPAGPGTGWTKDDRDSESMTTDPVSGRIWVGFENWNAIWRYTPGFARAEAHAAPRAMADWPRTKGPESLTLVPGGGMVAIAEGKSGPDSRARAAIRFTRDPVEHPDEGFRFSYIPPEGYDVSDAATTPDGGLLVLNRRFDPPFRFSTKLTLVDLRTIRPGARVSGREIATLAAPLIHDNFEGVTVTRERGTTIIWLVSDDNQTMLQRSLLLKFRYEPATKRAGSRLRPQRSRAS